MVFDVFAVVFDGGADERAGVAIAADELGGGGKGEVDEVVEDEDLSVAVGSGADADGWNIELGGDGGGGFAGNAFEDEGAGAGFGEAAGIGFEALKGFGGAGLDAVAAHAVKALGGKAEVADDGDFGVSEGADQLEARPLDFDGFSASLFDKADSIVNALVDCSVIAAKGHVGYDQGASNGTANGAGVMEHFIDGDSECVVVTEDHHGEGVADEEEVDSGFVYQAGGGVVVSGEGGDGLALSLHFAERRHGDFCGGESGRRERSAAPE